MYLVITCRYTQKLTLATPSPPLPIPSSPSPSPQEHLKILYYYPEDETLNRKIRNIGLCEALVNFSRTFSSDQPCEAVHTQRRRQVYFEPEPGIWIVMVRGRGGEEEGGKEGGREGGKEGGTEREGRREGGKKGEREGGRVEERDGGREEGRERGREGVKYCQCGDI